MQQIYILLILKNSLLYVAQRNREAILNLELDQWKERA